MVPRLLLLIAIPLLLLGSCGKKSSSLMESAAIVSLRGDVDVFNPVVSGEAVSSEINGLIYPQMFKLTFDIGLGKLKYGPALVKSWEFSNDGKDVRLVLRDDVRWEDGILVTPEDVKFSYELYGDPEVASPRNNYVDGMIFTDGKFDVDKSITIVDDSTMIFHFAEPYPQQLFHLTLSPIPRHIYRNADRRTLKSNPANEKPLSAGPFRLDKWVRQQEVVLVSNSKSNLPAPAKLQHVVLRVIDDPTTRLTELKKGTVDIMWPIQRDDVKDIQEQNPNIKLETLPPRNYDYVGWANIDFAEYRKTNGKTIRPHRLFGDRRVRQALTYAINRKGIIDARLGETGQIAITDFSPVFRWALRSDILPYPYSPDEARKLLESSGWRDTDGDGVIDKGGVKFEFTLMYNTGNARRAYAATVIQENLRQIGIRVNLGSAEPVVFFENLAEKKYDAFLAGFSVGLAIDPSDRWGDIRNPFNNTGFQNQRVRELITLGLRSKTDEQAARFWKDIQMILHQEQPCTFLYWIKDIVGYNRRLRNTNITILGVLDNMHQWTIADAKSQATF